MVTYCLYNSENGRKAGVEQIDISKGLISDVCKSYIFLVQHTGIWL